MSEPFKPQRNYTVYFEIFGKKLKTVMIAENAEQAKKKVIDKIIFHKVFADKKDLFNQSIDTLEDLVNILK